MASFPGRPRNQAGDLDVSLLTMIERAELTNPEFVLEELQKKHGITSVPELIEVLEDVQISESIPALWRLRLSKSAGVVRSNENKPLRTVQPPPPPMVPEPSVGDITGSVCSRWKPSGLDGPEIVVMQGDLTACNADAIVNAANCDLMHGGGLAGAIVRAGGSIIQDESKAWIRDNGRLSVGSAMFTSSGRLPCRYVIHTVGPNVSGLPSPTPTHTGQLRSAARSALKTGVRLGLSSIAIPGISTGIFGYPRDQGAQDIVRECVEFCREKPMKTIRLILLMNNDSPTVNSFDQALEIVATDDCQSIHRPSEITARTGRHTSGEAQNEQSSHQSRSSRNERNAWDGQHQRSSTSFTQRQKRAKDDDSGAHKAAGVMPIRVSSSGFEVLLGVEFRPFDNPSGHFVNFLGGKRDPGETPEATAGREFFEEVGKIIQKKDIRQLLLGKESSQKVWLPFAKYMLYIVHPSNSRFDSLPGDYKRRKRTGSLGSGAEHDYLLWVPWLSLVFAIQKSPANPVIQTELGIVPLSGMLRQFVKEFGTITEEHMEKMGIGGVIQGERVRIQQLNSLNDAELIAKMTHRDWKLHLTSPPVPPPPPIELLQPHDPDYKQTMSSLPPEILSNVVSVRRVRASARIGDYNTQVQQLKDQKATVNEEEPIYHGTPETWRATAIALNGFDLSIRLCGRAHGDGVYTATDINTSYHYSGGKGSILCLRGAVASNCKNRGEDTILPGDPVRVFPNTRCVLPRFIIDLAATDSRDTLEMQRQNVNDQYKLVLEKRKAMEASIKVQEAEFTQKMAKRLRNALAVYTQSFDGFDKSFSSKQGPSKLQSQEDLSRFDCIRQFFLERQHFGMCLPMYEVKHKLIQILEKNQVVILMADTGSGKSTQLPQIILDNVLPTGEARRIAVLQPRRVNAISLSRRVAEERGLAPGHEVGYTIGRGESNVTSTTRIEFMTHGLFVQMARNCDQLLSKYCAVIVDEAHERSVDVDLSLVFLKRALKQLQSKRDDTFFKVVVTSATITTEAKHFQVYLDPSMKTSDVVQIQGHMFPVHIEHRPVVEVDPQIVGTAGVNKVLTSAAIQTAMDILRSTETGSILIFLASEGSINDALDIARHDLLVSSGAEETIDTSFGSQRSSSFSFRMAVGGHDDDSSSSGVSAWLEQWKKRGNQTAKKKKQQRKTYITASIVGFHGKSTRAERDQVLNPPPDRRFVIFSTNVAETGVTLPDVRYVIDTGLERRVHWNAAVDVNEMVTKPITKSSMKQRAGRAGRTASGICIRLFPDPHEDNTTVEDSNTPGNRDSESAMQNSMIYKVVLLDKHMKQNLNEELELLDPIEPSMVARAEEKLQELSALDEDGNLTPEGDALLSLGTKLVSVLMASDGAERLLPDRGCLDRAELIEKFIDESGDHLTLLKLVEGFDEAQERGEGLSWCQDHGFDIDLFVDAETSREYLLKKLDDLKFSIIDDNEVVQENGGIKSSIRRALCAAYFDHLASPRADGTAKAGFTRILDAAKNQGTLDMMVGFAGKTQPAESDEGASDVQFNPQEPVIKASRHTTLWLDRVCSSDSSASKLVVFGSQMLTDGSKSVEPTVQLLSFVTEDEVSAGAGNWCGLVDLKKLIDSSARDTMSLSVTPGVRSFILADRGRWLKQLKRKFSSVFATMNRNEVVITCPRRIFGRVELHVKKLLRNIEPESVTLQLPEHVNMGKIIGKGRRLAKQHEENIQSLLSSERCGAGHLHVSRRQAIQFDSASREITVTLEGASKSLMSVIVGRIQSLIVETHGNDMLPLVTKVRGEPSGQLQQCPRLAQLMNSVPPTSWETRDDIMLQFAHALVWSCNASIYGGFLRDWVVRGESANDIDVRLSPPQITATSVESALQQFLAGSAGAQQRHVTVMRRGQKGSAFAVTFGADNILPFDIDLVDPSAILKKMHPGVDCDAGNLLLNRNQALCKKVEGAGDSLCAALENVIKKQFTFYYALDTGDAGHNTEALRRLKKYLSRNWGCLSPVPATVLNQLSSSERGMIRPSS